MKKKTEFYQIDTSDFFAHYGRQGMHWGQHIFAQAKSAGRAGLESITKTKATEQRLRDQYSGSSAKRYSSDLDSLRKSGETATDRLVNRNLRKMGIESDYKRAVSNYLKGKISDNAYDKRYSARAVDTLRKAVDQVKSKDNAYGRQHKIEWVNNNNRHLGISGYDDETGLAYHKYPSKYDMAKYDLKNVVTDNWSRSPEPIRQSTINSYRDIYKKAMDKYNQDYGKTRDSEFIRRSGTADRLERALNNMDNRRASYDSKLSTRARNAASRAYNSDRGKRVRKKARDAFYSLGENYNYTNY